MDTGAGTADAAEPRLATRGELDAAEPHVRRSPAEQGIVELIVRRPVPERREVVDAAELDHGVGLVGDCWSTKTTSSTPDGSPHPDRQVTLMNARAVDLVAAGDRTRWALAGDQLYVDLDLERSATCRPARGWRSGPAVLEVTAEPHRGCAQVHAALRARRHAVGQQRGGPRAQPARHQRPGGDAGTGPHRRPGGPPRSLRPTR